MPSSFRSSFMAASLRLLTLSAAAQTLPPPILLDRFDVGANRDEPLNVPSLAAAEQLIALTPGGAEVIDATRFRRGRASTFEDTFALSPGVIAQSRFGSDEARLSIRGSGLQRTFHGRGVRLLQDGVPLNVADGSFDMQAVEPLAADYVNVWRGANALALGASTLGGAIDYISPTGRGSRAVSARLELGSWHYQRAHVAAGGARGPVDAYLSLTHAAQESFRAHARQENQRLFANTALRLSATAETRLYLTAVRTRSELPGNLTLAQLRTDPRQAAAGNVALDQRRDFELARIASRTAVRLGDTVWDFTAAWTYKDLNHPIFQVVDQLTNDLLLGASVTRIGDTFGRSYRTRAGLLLHRGTTDAANSLNVGGRRGPRVSQAAQTATNLEAFTEDQLALTRRFTLIAGASAAANRRVSVPRFATTPGYALDYRRLMPKLGARFDLLEAQFFANFSASYEPPSFSETLTLNTAREAQTATTLEIGSRGTRGPARWEFALYHARLRHELLALDHDGNPATPAATINAGRTNHSGVEAGLAVDLLGAPWSESPARRLVFRAAWTHGRFRFEHDPRYGGNTLAGLPPHVVRGELMWETARGWFAGPTFEWVPEKTFIDFRNTRAAPPHAIAGARLGRRTARGLGGFIECRNITDRAYAATTGVIENAAGSDQPQFLPGDGRGFFAGIDYRW